jgi:hypothetical protein
MSGDLDDVGQMLDPSPMTPPPIAPPPQAVPVAAPAVPMSAMAPAASPMALPASVPNIPPSSPYASPVTRKGAAISAGVVQPLYEARNMIKVFGWVMFIVGLLQCLTIVYAIVGWLPLWMGWQVKGAAEALTVGVETGDKAQVHVACQRLATYFKIAGVLSIIWLVMVALALIFVLIMFIIGLTSASL